MFLFSKKKGPLFKLIGKSLKSSQLKEFTSQFDTQPEVSRFSDSYFHTYPDYGIELGFNLKDRLQSIHLFADGVKVKQYKGELPYQLSFDDARFVIEKKLGKATKTGGKGTWKFWMKYPRLGVTITFKSTSTTDRFNQISHITLS
jgi:hypothetical protein